MRNVIILGMHRSGTSMVAGALASVGLYAGESEELLADQQDNPHGFWERRDVVSLNDAILSASNASWFKPPETVPADSADFDDSIANILASMPSGRSCLIKDPRLLVTWPLWKRAVDDSVLLFVYRDPNAVAASLQSRNGFPRSLGLALWEHYNRLAIEAIQGQDAVSISYESVAKNPVETLTKMLLQLKEMGVASERPLADSVFDSSLGHAGVTAREPVGGLLSDSQRELAVYCEALCAGGLPHPLPVANKRLLPFIDDMANALAPLASVLETRIELAEMSRLCDERTSERDESLAQIKRLELEHTSERNKSLAQLKRLELEHTSERNKSLAQLKHLESEHIALTEAHRDELSRIYGGLLDFEQSFLAGIWRFTGRCYKFLTLRRGMSSGYEDVVSDARTHFKDHELNPPRKRPSKLSLLGDVVKYVFQNPAGSARSFSLARLRRATAVFLKLDPDDLDVWIHSRFPTRENDSTFFDTTSLDKGLDRMEIVFPVSVSPKVSIVVPVFNDYRLTKHCLKSIMEHSGDVSYEVIIGDDCSTDMTASITDRVSNIKVVKGEKCRGFLGNCNDAAVVARGDYILFLNNDTAVCRNWLTPLVDIMERDTTVGIVGPKLLFGDGKLQEAGGIVWNDGSAWNFGRGDNPDKPEYNYVKEVDYISGACLLIRADLWRQLDGFDRRYTPAYYEDTDIAFEVRALGYKVVYQPLSSVVHYEGVSSGTDLNSGVKQYQVKNQKKFREKWQRELDEFHFPNAQHVFQARDRSRNQRCVMFIDHYVPHYDKDAGSRSTFMYVQLMLEMGYKVMFMGANFFPHKPYTEKLQQIGVEVLVGEHMARSQDRWLKESAPYIDRIYLHRPHIAEQVLGSLEKMTPRPPIIFFGHDLHYLRIRRQYEVLGEDTLYRSAQKWRKREYAVFDRVDKIYYPSQVEVGEILEQRPDLDVRAIPLYVLDDDNAPPYDFDGSSDILFVGGFNHPPNVDGICWFVDEILPLVTRERPDIRLHVVGSNPTDAVQDLQSEQVLVYGYLSDDELDAFYRRTRQVVVPLRFGAGVKGKVLEAIQKNVPLVTTAIGAEGIPDASTVMSIADSARNFADKVIRLDAGDPEILAKLDAYPEWLQKGFSKDGAAQIIRDDFGSPQR